ncbi:hypothetical protein R6Q57_007545 [Mikania cordata]
MKLPKPSCHLVNIAKYGKEKINGETQRNRTSKESRKAYDRAVNQLLKPRMNSHFNSYRDTLLQEKIPTLNVKTINVGNMRTATVDTWGTCSVVGRTSSLTYLCKLDSILEEERGNKCLIRYLGGVNVLLTFNKEHDASQFLRNEKKWEGYFSKVIGWNGQSIQIERVAWLKIMGVPPQLWDSTVMNQIGEKFGTVFKYSKASTSDTNLTIDGEEVIIKWQNKKFRGWVMEYRRPWVPDFVNGESPKTSLPNWNPDPPIISAGNENSLNISGTNAGDGNEGTHIHHVLPPVYYEYHSCAAPSYRNHQEAYLGQQD